MSKRIIFSLVAVTMLLSAMVFPVANAATVTSFSDVNPIHPNYQAIDYLREKGDVVGYEDGTYGEDRNINRAEFLKIVMEASDYEIGGENCYPDVNDEWFAQYVCAATELGFVEGYPDGLFRPAGEINFAEASKMIVNVLGYDLSGGEENWFEQFVKTLDVEEVIPADIDSFDHKLTRADMAEMIWRLDTETTYKVSNTYENIRQGKTVTELGGELKNFESCKELATYFENNTGGIGYPVPLEKADAMVQSAPAQREGEAAEAVVGDTGLGGGSAEDYSQTNVQVSGVDEADIVKNDGKYVYYLREDTIRIVEAFPPSEMKEVSVVDFDDSGFYPSEMYVDDDRLIVIGSSWSYKAPGVYFEPHVSVTRVFIYDISDRANVELMRELNFETVYNSSRKVDGTLYLVMSEYNYQVPYFEEEGAVEEQLVPVYEDSATGEVQKIAGCGEVKHIPGVIDTPDYLVVVAIPTGSADAVIDKEVVMGSSADIYASTENLYVAQQKYSWWGGPDVEEETFVHKFALGPASLDYEGVGVVPGYILNQFSMDEKDGYFRIATTKGGWSDEMTNNVYVLDSDLDLVGRVEGLASGEQIYSTRFVGNRLYMVTFEQIDPLFVIDLSDPLNPAVLGELKVPGVSNYLHPLDENHIIGFGLDTPDPDVVEEAGWVWFQGIKLSLFDVTDVNNPVELHTEVIGDRGTWSELSSNHKALLFDDATGLMAFPVTVAEIPAEIKADPDLAIDDWVYGDEVFQGAYVYNVSIENGFELQGTISHFDEEELGDNFDYYYWYGDDKGIERILYIGDYFYTVSNSLIQANLKSTLDKVKELWFGN